jgi:hypothetical protein
VTGHFGYKWAKVFWVLVIRVMMQPEKACLSAGVLKMARHRGLGLRNLRTGRDRSSGGWFGFGGLALISATNAARTSASSLSVISLGVSTKTRP